jgi:hypothetical protein
MNIAAEEDNVMKKIRCALAHKVDRTSAICSEVFSEISKTQSLGHFCILDAKVCAVTAVNVPAPVSA